MYRLIKTIKGKNIDEDEDGYPDPEVIYDIKNSSGTAYEYPVVVDVDNDGSTEIVVSSNNYSIHTVTGVRAFEDPEGHWVRTRRIWNQHSYHVTNINEDGSVPVKETPNWSNPKLNNYRQNVQPDGLFNAPNLVAKELKSIYEGACPPIKLEATVANEGSLTVKAGVSVSFYVKNADDAGHTGYIGHATVNQLLSRNPTNPLVLPLLSGIALPL